MNLGRTLRTWTLAAAALLAVTPAHAEPAMWAVKDKDSTIYLFGTVHILPSDAVWRTPRVEAALKESKSLVLEIGDLSSIWAQVTSAFVVVGQGMSFTRPLSSRLNPQQIASLDRAARQAGLTAESMNYMRPWMAAMMLQAGQAVSSGMDVNSGVDMQLQKQFSQARLPVSGFETVGDQVGIFSKMTPEAELAFLLDTVEAMDVADADFDTLVDSWEAGDVSALDREAVTMKREEPALYNALVLKRNTNWVGQIEKMLAGKGTSFVAVGALHLAGPDGVPALLKAKGLEVVRR